MALSTYSNRTANDLPDGTEQTFPGCLVFNGGLQFDDWADFIAHLKSRPKPGLPKQFSDHDGPLLWGMPRSLMEGQEIEQVFCRLADLHSGSERFESSDEDLICKLEELLDDSFVDSSAASESELSDPLIVALIAAIGLASAMPDLAQARDSNRWMATLNRLAELRQQASQQSGLPAVLSNELAMTIGSQFPEIDQLVEELDNSRANLETQLDELLDADGAILARYIKWVPTFLASWSRTILWTRHHNISIDDDAIERWEWFVRFSMRLLRSDGTSMLGDDSIPFSLPLYKTATRISNDKNDRLIARGLLPGGNPKEKKVKLIHEEGTFSEWAGVAVFQQDWSPNSPRVAIATEDEKLSVEVCRGDRLFQLTCLPDVSVNGKRLNPDDDWDEIASHFDDDIDYLELEIELSETVRLQRQICLVHDDEVVLIADAVFSETEERIDYRNSITLGDRVTPMKETENNEVYLQVRGDQPDSSKEIRSLIMPLNLSEWKSATRSSPDDSFGITDDEISITQSTLGKTLYAPMAVVLNPDQSVMPRTWRRLTVVEAMQTVSDDVARAYRICVGDSQWVLYKSFAEPGNRTFLGQNHTCDLFIGRFQKDGDVEELLSLEP